MRDANFTSYKAGISARNHAIGMLYQIDMVSKL